MQREGEPVAAGHGLGASPVLAVCSMPDRGSRPPLMGKPPGQGREGQVFLRGSCSSPSPAPGLLGPPSAGLCLVIWPLGASVSPSVRQGSQGFQGKP